MRIESNRPVKASAARRGERGTASTSGTFSDLLSADPAAGAVAPASVGGIGGLISLQEVDDERGRRRRAAERGDALLDRLDELRHGLLMGTFGQDQLARLVRQIQSSRVAVGDPRLQEVLDEIELRARVELAKLETAL